ncbi:Ras guanine nucleotide exchange factor [Entamoeba marina]
MNTTPRPTFQPIYSPLRMKNSPRSKGRRFGSFSYKTSAASTSSLSYAPSTNSSPNKRPLRISLAVSKKELQRQTEIEKCTFEIVELMKGKPEEVMDINLEEQDINTEHNESNDTTKEITKEKEKIKEVAIEVKNLITKLKETLQETSNISSLTLSPEEQTKRRLDNAYSIIQSDLNVKLTNEIYTECNEVMTCGSEALSERSTDKLPKFDQEVNHLKDLINKYMNEITTTNPIISNTISLQSIVDICQKFNVKAEIDKYCVAAASVSAFKAKDGAVEKLFSESALALKSCTLQILTASVDGDILSVTAACVSTLKSLKRYADTTHTAISVFSVKESVRNEEVIDDNIWDVYNDTNNTIASEIIIEDKKIKAASLNALLLELTSESVMDNDTQEALLVFVHSFGTFTSASVVLRKLIERYQVPEHTNPLKSLKIKARVSALLKLLIQNAYDEFDETSLQFFTNFVDTQMVQENPTYAKMLQTFMKRKKLCRTQLLSKNLVPPITPYLPQPLSAPHFFSLYDHYEIARQMTIVDHQIYKSIDICELFDCAFSKQHLMHHAPNAVKLFNRVNDISYWAATLILMHKEAQERAKIMEKLINVADVLMKMNNFQSLAGLFVGLDAFSAVSRLKKTRALLPQKSIKILSKLTKWLGLDNGNYSLYRNHLKQLKEACVPFIAVAGKDLTFISEGNVETIEVKGLKLLNFERQQMSYDYIVDFLSYQQYDYNYPIVEPLNTFLLSPVAFPENYLYDLSLIYEPRSKT